MTEKIQIRGLLTQLNKRAARAVVSQLGIRIPEVSNYIRKQFEHIPGEEGSFLGEPVFEATFGWKPADITMAQLENKLFHKNVLHALNNPPKNKDLDLEQYVVPYDRHPYQHQLDAWKTLLDKNWKSTLITSGTGSGKTECFLMPILQDLYREYEQEEKQLVGVRALFLYPLNALINSQRERLKAWTGDYKGNIRFCLYNGDTPRKRTPINEQREFPEEVMDRVVLRESPPPILVTNSTMLEYMLVRNDDQPILEKSQGALRWIVLDEAHTYIGSQAAELSLLLRRVIDTFNVDVKNVKFVATSATIGGSDKKSLEDLKKFLSDVAGVSTDQIKIIVGKRSIPILKETEIDDNIKIKNLKLSENQFELLEKTRAARRVRNLLSESPHSASTKQILSEVRKDWPEISREDVWDFLDILSNSENSEQSFLPLRTHIFQKTLNGIHVCCNASCEYIPNELKDTNWGFGAIYLNERDFCTCGAPVQPMVSCSGCGQEYLEGEDHRLNDGSSKLSITINDDDDNDFLWDLDPDDILEDHRNKEVVSDRQRVLLHSKFLDRTSPFKIQKNSRILSREETSITLYGQYESDGLRCHTCGMSEPTKRKIFFPKRLGAPFFLGDSLPTLLEYSPQQGEGPFDSRRLLTFTDSRQGTARIAARLQQDVDRNKVRSTLYHKIHSLEDKSGEKKNELLSEINPLEEAIRLNPSLKDQLLPMLEKKRKELLDLNDNYSISLTWEDAEETLNNSRDISRYMYDTFSQIGQYDVSKNKFGQFCLYREFMRRPRRGFQMETLGLIELFYPDIEELDTAPSIWNQLYKKNQDGFKNLLSDWKDWLTILIDMHFRENSAVDVPEAWFRLMGARVNRKYAVGPNDPRTEYILRWPSARRSTQSRVVGLLLRGFKLNKDDKSDIDLVEEILMASWIIIQSKVLVKLDEGRFLLDLKNKSAFRKVNKAWKCPYTLRPITRLFHGQSYNTRGDVEHAMRCEEIEFPDLKYPNNLDKNGHLVPKEKINLWIESDEVLNKARKQSVWPNRADRIASGESWYRIEEHSAQIESKELKRLEALFKDGKLNVLSCSTTMEMGVDIGGMSVVAMNNVPPHPANYLQRAGRAGRRNEKTSISYTLCNNSAHSMQVFSNPMWPFEPGVMAAPKVNLQSENIVQRHINAFLLAHWLRQFGDSIEKLTSGWMMSELIENEPSHMEDFIAWCNSIEVYEKYAQLEKSCAYITRKTALENLPLFQLVENTSLSADEIFNSWNKERNILLEERKSIVGTRKTAEKEPAVKSIDISLKRMENEYLLSELTSGGFLPGYGFPTDVVSLNTVTVLNLKQNKERESREDSFGYRHGNPSRNLAIALREYAPGAEIVIGGLVYKSAGVTLNWHKPSNIEGVSEIQNLYSQWHCNVCGEFGTSRKYLNSCPNCNAEAASLDHVNVLEPAGFAVDLYADPHTDVNQPVFMPFEDPLVAANHSIWNSLPEPKLGCFRYDDKGTVSHINSGLHGKGYSLCLTCGKAAPQEIQGEVSEIFHKGHRKLRGGKGGEHGSLCDGTVENYAIKRDLRLGTNVYTSVFEIQLRDPNYQYEPLRDPVVAWTIGYALRNALTNYIGIDEREVDVSVRDMMFSDKQTGLVLSLFDTASLGAGYVEILQNDLINIMKLAKNYLNCSADCDSVCQYCLLDASTQFKENLLNRHVAIEWLDGWLQASVLPKSLQYFGEYSKPVLSSLRHQIELLLANKKITWAQFFVDYDEVKACDLSEWIILQTTIKLISNDVDVDWILITGNKDYWKEHCGNQLVAVLEMFGHKLSIKQLSVPNKINNGVLIMGFGHSGVSSYFAGDDVNLNIGDEWGKTINPVVTNRKGIDKFVLPLTNISKEELKPELSETSVSLRLDRQIDGRLQFFGKMFFEWIQEESPLIKEQLSKNVKIKQVTYSDRYIRTPFNLLLLYRILDELEKINNNNDFSINIQSMNFSEQKYPTRIFHNFSNSHDRDNLLEYMLLKITNNISISSYINLSQVAHYRVMSIEWNDGVKIDIIFDQGMGAWKYSGHCNWDNSVNISEKYDLLIKDNGRAFMSERWGTVINLKKV